MENKTQIPPVSPSVPWSQDARIAGTVGFAHLSSHFFQLLLPPLFPWLMHDFNMSYVQAGFLATVFFAISAGGQALAGFAVDRLGALRMLQFGVALLVCSGLALGWAHSYAGLMLSAALAGTGNAIFHPADYTILNRRISPARLGHAFAWHGLSGNLGWVAGSAFMVGMANHFGWHAAGFGAAAIAASAWLVLTWQHQALDHRQTGVKPAAVVAAGAAEPAKQGLFAFFGSSTVWLCFGFFFLATGASGSLQNFAPLIFSHLYGLNLANASLCLSAFLVGGVLGMLAGGFIAGKHKRSDRIVAMALTVSCLLAFALASGHLPTAGLMPLMFLMGLGQGVAGPSRDLLVRHAAAAQFGPAAFGRVYGFVYSGVDCGIAVAPLVIGAIMDKGQFQGALLGIAVLLLAAVLTALGVGRLGLRPELRT